MLSISYPEGEERKVCWRLAIILPRTLSHHQKKLTETILKPLQKVARRHQKNLPCY